MFRRKYRTEEEQRDASRAQARKRKQKQREEGREKPRTSRKGYEPWQPKFIGMDGESFLTGEFLPDGTPRQAYCLLLRNDKQPIYKKDGLSTWDCLNYLSTPPPAKTALVGYFLNFDFEWILKDLTQEQYKDLQAGLTVELFYGEYQLQWFVGKKLVIYRLKPSFRFINLEDREINKHYRMITYQDTQGFFQSSFIQALKKWGFKDDPRLKVITSGKAARGGFRHEDLEEVSHYNKMEMDLLQELMTKLYHSFKAAYETAKLDFRVNSQTWSGPGVFANDFLKQTLWNEQHEQPSEDLKKKYRRDKYTDFGNDQAKDFPFSLAYYGGRIELGAAGRFKKGHSYDVNSGYPYAISLLPSWKEKDFKIYKYQGFVTDPKGAKPLLDRRLMGMYKVRFTFPKGWSWYPFPVRDVSGGSPNVYYPRKGVTYIMSAELFAALDTLTDDELKEVSILDAFVLENTENYGDGLERTEQVNLSKTAIETFNMADVRLASKAASKRVGTPTEREGDQLLATAEKALKLILNSLYGKTVQQIGSHKYYNDFAATWITSTCRALLWRAIAQERNTTNVLMLMTDGIYSLKPLKFAEERISSVLGEWEATPFDSIETFKPGIYRYEHDGVREYKVRGFLTPTQADRERLFKNIWESLTTNKIPLFPARNFLTRNISLDGWKMQSYRHQFVTTNKEIKAELKAKRAANDVSGWKIESGKNAAFFPPKGENELNHSKGYALNFEAVIGDVTEEDVDEWLMGYDSREGLEEFYFDIQEETFKDELKKDYIKELVEEHGYIKVQHKWDFYHREYLSIPAEKRRQYFRQKGMPLDVWCEAVGLEVDDVLERMMRI